jgi:colanic acid biosynthesis glycosyl transferase WcaI
MYGFREEENLGDGFIFMHAGNIGLILGNEYVIEAAEITRGQADLLYCYLGPGLMKPRLEQMVSEKGLSNVRFLPLRPREDMPLFLPAADCHLVSLDRGSTRCLPSWPRSWRRDARWWG